MFLVGFMLGGGCFLLLYAHRVDSYLSERNVMYYSNNQKQKEILKLQEQIAKLGQRGNEDDDERIRNIDVEVRSDQPAISDAAKAELEQRLSPFLDKSMEWISNNPELVEMTLEKSRIELGHERPVKLAVHLRWLSFHRGTMKLWVDVEEVSDKETG